MAAVTAATVASAGQTPGTEGVLPPTCHLKLSAPLLIRKDSSVRRLAALLSVLALLLPTPAFAGGFDTYVTKVTGVQPAMPGVRAVATSNGEQITVTDSSATPLIIEGYQHDQYLKVSSAGVWQNKLSPAVYLNKEATIGAIPDDANASRPPVWVKLNGTDHAQWHDHRIHWMGVAEPPVVQQDPKHSHLINDWRIPVVYGGRAGTITGTLSYRPGSHLGSYVTYGAIGVGVVVILGLQILILRRRRGSSPGTDLTAG